MKPIILIITINLLLFIEIKRKNINFPIYYLNLKPQIHFKSSIKNFLFKLKDNVLLINGNFGFINYNNNIHNFNKIYIVSPGIHSIGKKIYDAEILIESENNIGNKIILSYLFTMSEFHNSLFDDLGFSLDIIKSLPIFNKSTINKKYKIYKKINLKKFWKTENFWIYNGKFFTNNENVTYLINYREYKISKFNLGQINLNLDKGYKDYKLDDLARVFFNFNVNKSNKHYFVN